MITWYNSGTESLLLYRTVKDTAVIIRLSGPIKKQFAIDNNLDYEMLLSTATYKEKYRYDMIDWSQKIRAKNPSFFIDKALEMYAGRQYIAGDSLISSQPQKVTDSDFAFYLNN